MKMTPLSGIQKWTSEYPANFSHGYFSRHLLEDGLSDFEIQARQDWLTRIQENQELFLLIESQIDKPQFQHAFDRSIGSHGLFYERFFDHEVKIDVRQAVNSSNVDKERLGNLTGIFWNRPRRESLEEDQSTEVLMRLKDLYILRLLDDANRLEQLKNWYTKFKKTRNCQICGTEFQPISLPPYIYFGSNGQSEICFNCPVVAKPRKKELCNLIPAFVESCGFIPSAQAGPWNFHFMSRQMKAPVSTVLSLFAQMGGINHVKKKFGSWFEALAETGALPNGTLVTARGIRCVANDGHVCNSTDEKRIDDWLTANKIAHTKEPKYPFHSIYNSNGLRRADWLANDFYIEYFGLVGDEKYDKKVEEKILLCSNMGLKILPIYPKDLNWLDQRMLPILKPAN